MKIEPGKLYKTRGGQKARIYHVHDDEGYWPVHGAVFNHGIWSICSWKKDGTGDRSIIDGPFDLIEEWTEPKKTKELWLWVMKTQSGEYINFNYWQTEEDVKKLAKELNYELIGKDPNCLKPLVVEE